jgi:hypothetical protein
MASPEGQTAFGYLLEFCHVLRDSVDMEMNTNRTFFNEGQRSVGNEISALMLNNPEAFRAAEIRRAASIAEGKDL